ncbi:MAG: hypothetical protein ACHQD9_08990, partial [Chitinophagales bacterium]
YKPAPQKVVELKDVKPVQERNATVPKNVTAPKEHVQPQPAPKQNTERRPLPAQQQDQKQNQEQQDQQPNPKFMNQNSRSNEFAISSGNKNEINRQQMIRREQVPAQKNQVTTSEMNRQIAKAPSTKMTKQNYQPVNTENSFQRVNESRVVSTAKSATGVQRQQMQPAEKKKKNPKD